MSEQKYEYRVFFYKIGQNAGITDKQELINIEKYLNTLGDEGWELCAADTDYCLYYFKRLKRNP